MFHLVCDWMSGYLGKMVVGSFGLQFDDRIFG